MDLLQNDSALADMVHRLVEVFHPRRIYLFGSKARGESGPDSDYDLMVVVEESELPGYQRDQKPTEPSLDWESPKTCSYGPRKNSIVGFIYQHRFRLQSYERENYFMPHDAYKVSEVQAWLLKALHDLQAAEILLQSNPPLSDIAIFHCQQAAEKSFKAFLFWNDIPFRKTRELEELGQACQRVDVSMKEIMDKAVELTPFAWRFRYPG